MQLTRNGVQVIKSHGTGAQRHNPPLVLKLVGFKKVDNKTGTPRYRVILTDGIQNVQGLVVPQFHHLFENDGIPPQSILLLSQIGVSQKGETPFLILHDIQVYSPDGERIGSDPAPAQTQSTSTAPAVSQDQPPQPSNTDASQVADSSKPNIPTSGNEQFQQLYNQPPPQAYSHDPNAPITTPIAAINPYQNNWTILARLSLKADIKKYTNAKGSGQLCNFTFMDKSGEIRATCFNEQVDQFYNELEVNKIYYISQAKVNAARKEFSSLPHDYELMFNSNTTIVPAPNVNVDIPKTSFNFKKISELDNAETGTYVDVIGVVKQAYDLSTILTKNDQTELSKRDIYLVDDTSKSIKLTLWGSVAESTVIDGQPIIACKGVRVGEYQGKTLSTTSASHIELNPEINESYALRRWFDTQGHNAEFQSFNKTTSTGGQKSKIMDISQIKEEDFSQDDKPTYFSIRASILHIRNSNFAYPACSSENCSKKVFNRDENQWFCETCQRTYPNPKYRYTLSANVADHTGQLWVSLFDASGNALLEKSADQLMQFNEMNPELTKEIFSEVCNKEYIFKCSAKHEIYNDQSRVKYNVWSVNDVDFVQGSNGLLDEISQYS